MRMSNGVIGSQTDAEKINQSRQDGRAPSFVPSCWSARSREKSVENCIRLLYPGSTHFRSLRLCDKQRRDQQRKARPKTFVGSESDLN